MRYLLGGLSLITFVAFFPLVAYGLKGEEYSMRMVAGILAIVCILASYFFNRAARRLRTS